MNDGLDKIVKGSWEAVLGGIGKLVDNWRYKRRLVKMLRDQRFPKGFRSTSQLCDGIGCDPETTRRLLIAIGARKSEISDEWTLNPPR